MNTKEEDIYNRTTSTIKTAFLARIVNHSLYKTSYFIRYINLFIKGLTLQRCRVRFRLTQPDWDYKYYN